MVAPKTSFKEKLFSGLLMYIVGFAGFSLLAALVVTALIALGILPQI